MRFWCSQLFEPWSWVPRPYLGVWLIIGLTVLHRHRAIKRGRALGHPELTTRQRWWFWLALGTFWLASDWPVGALGAGYLAWVHMLQYLIYTLLTGALVLLSIPEWRFREFVDRYNLESTVRILSKPLLAGVIANVILIATHSPLSVDNLRSTQYGSFTLDVIWFIGGLLLWLPIVNPVPEWRIRSMPGRMIYLFLAAQLLPMIPGGFLTFAGSPLYSTYELAPRINVDPLADQQIAGAIMKVGSLPVVWTVILVLWVQWAQRDSGDRSYVRTPTAGAPPDPDPDDADVPQDASTSRPAHPADVSAWN